MTRVGEARAPVELRLRLIRADDRPATNPEGDAFEFGLQDARQQLVAGVPDAAGRLAWEFSVTVKPGKGGAPSFTGAYASGPAHDRFVYLAWRSILRSVWINRVKARLSSIDWPLIEAAQGAGRVLEADMTGRQPGGHDVAWRLADG